jgi:hypothetical protein
VERDVLPSEKLKPYYDKVVWLYCYNDFSKSDKDLKAERIRMRFGVSSWPQLLFMDAATLAVIHEGARDVAGLIQAIDDAASKVKRPDNAKELHKKLADAEELAAKLHKARAVPEARKNVMSDDLVVRAICVEILAKEDPDALLEHALKLLDTPADQTRSGVCKAIATAKKLPKDEKEVTALRLKLEAIFKDPKGSRNPNVLRFAIAEALGRVGDARTLEVLKPVAVEGAYFNGLTRIVDETVAAIGARDDAALETAVAILIDALPVANAADGERGAKACANLAAFVYEKLKALTGLDPGFPRDYTEATRKELQEKFRAWLTEREKKPGKPRPKTGK